MSITQLLRRTLTYFAGPNLAVISGVIAATATITGALIVGDSVRGSLRDMTLQRLGSIQHVLTGMRFLTEPTVEAAFPSGHPAILVTGTLKTKERLSGSVQIVGVPNAAGAELWPDDGLNVEDDQVVLNARVAADLGATVGQKVSLLVELPASVPRDSLLGERDEVLVERVLTVSEILGEESGAGRFALSPAQQIPSVAYVSLLTLQRTLDIDAYEATRRTDGRLGRVNAALVAVGDEPLAQATDSLNDHLSEQLTLDDVDLRLIETGGENTWSVESRAQILSEGIADATHRAAMNLQASATEEVLVYLVNEIANAKSPDRFSTYSVVGGITSLAEFEFIGEPPTAPLKPGEVAINAWLQEDLGVDVGDEIVMKYLEVGDTGDLPELETTFKVAAIIAMSGRGVDRTLTPTVPGITDAETYGDWEQPYTMDLNRVTDRDEDYWDEHRATPKVLLSLDEMQERFGSRYGKLTSIRVSGVSRDALAGAILEELTPEETGLVVRDVRAEQLSAASGTTDFSGLFFGFSLFLIAAAVLLIGLLFRLGVDQRTSQFGLLRAVGWAPSRVSKLLLSEGLSLACFGALIGTFAAIGYAAAMLYGLTTWWGGATGTRFLTLHITPVSLTAGAIIAVLVAMGTMWGAIRRLGRSEPRPLLAGQMEDSTSSKSRSQRARWVAIFSLGTAALLLIGLLADLVPTAEAFAGFSWRVIGFFITGTLGLVGGLTLLASMLGATSETKSFDLTALGWLNVARARGRSLLTTSLIACASFLLVAVAVAKMDPTAEEPKIDSGNGGYRLVAESTTPILTDINTWDGREDAQFLGAGDDALFESVSVASMRLRPGDDASCLNLYASRLPTLLGVPEDVLRRWHEEGRFAFADTPSDQPWLDLLSENTESESELSVPVLGDMNTLLYSLHKGVGLSIDVPTEVHPSAEMNVVGMLSGSVFQGMLIMSDDNLRSLDPGVVGYRYFLVESNETDTATSLLESGLADYGFDSEPVSARIANFLAVQNTYLTTFQTLGGLGLLLGTLGLGTVMLRNVVERSRELALMRAIGFAPARLARLILGETALLLGAGLIIGTATALLAMSPHILSAGAVVPWKNLAILLVAVFLVGMVAAAAAVRRATKISVLSAMQGQ